MVIGVHASSKLRRKFNRAVVCAYVRWSSLQSPSYILISLCQIANIYIYIYICFRTVNSIVIWKTRYWICFNNHFWLTKPNKPWKWSSNTSIESNRKWQTKWIYFLTNVPKHEFYMLYILAYHQVLLHPSSLIILVRT